MRDVLTILAGVVILLLAAALAVPPLVDWPSHRGLVERGLSRALGQEVRTEGRLDLRLLPTPRIRVERLRIDPRGAEGGLDAMYVRAELGLTPLLSGEVRLLDARLGRAEVKLPVGRDGAWSLPARRLADAAAQRGWALETMRIEQLLVTLFDPATGRTDQHAAEGVRVQAGAPLGPWRIDGRSRGHPFEIAMGEMAPDRTAPLKLGFGAVATGRLDLDGHLALVPMAGDLLRPRLSGLAKAVLATAPFPIQGQATVLAEAGTAELSDLAIEAGEGAAALRLTGDGRLGDRLALRLAGRRVDLRAVVQAARAAAGDGPRAPPLPVELDLRLDGVGVGGDEDLTGLSLALLWRGDWGELRRFEVAGPGRSQLRAGGDVWLKGGPGANGHLALEAADGARLARSLASLGLPGLTGLLEARPLQARAQVSLVGTVVSARDLRVTHGDLRLSGLLRHSDGDAGIRPRLDAQLAVEGLDVEAVPSAAPIFALAQNRDLAIALDARNVAHGGRKGGRISGRILAEGADIRLDALDVRDLAGAEASLAGRLAADGSGRIEGRLSAPRAAPLLDLFGRAWLGELSRLMPAALRGDAIDLRVEVERTGIGPGPPTLVRLRGKLADAPFEAESRSEAGILTAVAVKTELRRLLGPAERSGEAPLSISARRGPDGRMEATLASRLGGLALRTVRPIRLAPTDDRLDGGEIAVEGADAAPLLRSLGFHPGAGALPVALTARLGGAEEAGKVTLLGEIARTKLSAELSQPAPGQWGGQVSVDTVSLPWLAAAVALGPIASAGPDAFWPTARFADPPSLPYGGTIAVRTTSLALGGGVIGRDAAFTLAVSPGGLRVSRLETRLGGGRLRAEFGIDRQGGLAALTGDAALEELDLAALLSGVVRGGRLAAKLRFGGSGESVAALVANLGGAGDVAIEDLRVDGADPTGPARLGQKVLRTDDPLSARNWQPQIAGELDRGPLRASGTVAASGALVGGALRLAPLRIEAAEGSWQGSATIDLRSRSLEARGALQSREPPRGWSGAAPTLGLNWSGPAGRVVRSVDPAALVNGLATNILARELDRVDTFELDAAERRRRQGRQDMERQRREGEARRAEEKRAEELRRRASEPPLPPPRPDAASPDGG